MDEGEGERGEKREEEGECRIKIYYTISEYRYYKTASAHVIVPTSIPAFRKVSVESPCMEKGLGRHCFLQYEAQKSSYFPLWLICLNKILVVFLVDLL